LIDAAFLMIQCRLFDPDERKFLIWIKVLFSPQHLNCSRCDFGSGRKLRLSPACKEMAQDRFITVYSTTSAQDSGLFGHLLPIFQAATGLRVEVAAVGTGKAISVGRRGYADALFVHDRRAEDKFIADGYGVDRRDVM
jgi:hypothetical protein